MRRTKYHIVAICVLVFAFVALLFFDLLYAADMYTCDILYKKLERQTRDIRIIAIDEKTEAEYGKFENWSRDKLAQLTELLSENPDKAPAVLAFDIMFIGDSDKETDTRLAQACSKAENVVCASNLVFKGEVETDTEGGRYYNAGAIAGMETPYSLLCKEVSVGFANAGISKDNIIRNTMLHAQVDGNTVDSFAFSAYKAYAEKKGLPFKDPMEGKSGQIGFFYSGKPGEIPKVSLADVLSGKVPLTEFEDCLVLVGVYAPGFQDNYNVPVSGGEQMYGVEINANIVRALMLGKLYHKVPITVYAAVSSVILLFWGIMLNNKKLRYAALEAAILIFAHLAAGRALALNGFFIPQIYFIVAVLLIAAYYIIIKYITEKTEHHQTVKTLKRYVAPQIVDKLSKDGGFELRLGGEKRHIAVLFVDVRGFTTISELLHPEDVVNILNQYLSITTEAIFRNEGTLDKFVGDATMAVFNAPFEQDDYIFKAVKTAWDIQEGVKKLAGALEEQYQHKISVGIGVNCGEAVVGNIGCETRMDYTAIGDTVNTAARLESNAPKDQILISQSVYDAVAERVETESIGELSLKGKTEKIPVYRVIGFR